MQARARARPAAAACRAPRRVEAARRRLDARRTAMPAGHRPERCASNKGLVGALRLHHRRGHGAHALRRRAPAHARAGHGGQAARARGETTHVLGHGLGLQPVSFAEQTPFAGAYLAVVESVAKLVAAGFEREDMYLTLPGVLREACATIPSAGASPWRPCSARSWRRSISGVGAIGGKDSMSGSFEELGRAAHARVLRRRPSVHDRPRDLAGVQGRGRPRHLRFAATTDALAPEAIGCRRPSTRWSASSATGVVRAASSAGLRRLGRGAGQGGRGQRPRRISVDEGIDTGQLFEPAYGSFVIELAAGADAQSVARVCEDAGLDADVDVVALGQSDQRLRAGVRRARWPISPWCRRPGKRGGGLESVFPYRTSPEAARRRRARARHQLRRRGGPGLPRPDAAGRRLAVPARGHPGVPRQQLRVRLRCAPSSGPGPWPTRVRGEQPHARRRWPKPPTALAQAHQATARSS